MTIALENLAGLFDRRFLATYLGPSLLFVGVMAVLIGAAFVPAGLGYWTTLDTLSQLMVLVGAAGTAVVLSAGLQAATVDLVQLYEGYWWPLRLLESWGIANHARHREQLLTYVNGVQAGSAHPASVLTRYAQCVRLLSTSYPPVPKDGHPDRLLPTRLGNTLASAEAYPQECYGLDGVSWWPRLVPLVPEQQREDLAADLSHMIGMLNFCTAFLFCALLGGIVAIVGGLGWGTFLLIYGLGLIAARACYGAAIAQAQTYADGIRACYDLHRLDIIQAMHVPLPQNLHEERELWSEMEIWLIHRKQPNSKWPPDSGARERWAGHPLVGYDHSQSHGTTCEASVDDHAKGSHQ